MADSVSSGGVGFMSLLLLLFIGLKLGGLIQWSWWWVMSPLWIPLILLGVCVVMYAACISVGKDR